MGSGAAHIEQTNFEVGSTVGPLHYDKHHQLLHFHTRLASTLLLLSYASHLLLIMRNLSWCRSTYDSPHNRRKVFSSLLALLPTFILDLSKVAG